MRGAAEAVVDRLADAVRRDRRNGDASGVIRISRVEQVEQPRCGFDPEQLKLGDLLDIFFATHDATTLNRQGNDVGTQYRSAMFPADDAQKAEMEAALERAQADSPKPIVTTIEPMDTWYEAEGYHQDYWETSGRSNPYCMAVIPPKLQKLRKSFAARSKAAVSA